LPESDKGLSEHLAVLVVFLLCLCDQSIQRDFLSLP
jgi:hypothetical protein